MAVSFFVQNVTSPVESEVGIGVHYEADNAAGALAQFEADHAPALGEQVVVIALPDVHLFEYAEQAPEFEAEDLSSFPLPEVGN